MADGGDAGVPLRRMRGEIHAVELLDDVLELVRDELLHVMERCDLDGGREMTLSFRVIRVVARTSKPGDGFVIAR